MTYQLRSVTRPRTLLAMDPAFTSRLFDEDLRARLAEVADVVPDVIADDFGRPEVVAALAEAEVLLTFWGVPVIDDEVLAAAPKLRAVVHAAGSVKHFTTPACWERGLTMSTAAGANSLPVAEYTVAMILLAGKRILEMNREYTSRRIAPSMIHGLYQQAGNYRRTIGLVGASRVGRRVIELLRPYDLDLLVHDPHLSLEEASTLGVRLLPLDALCAEVDILTIHAPELNETRHLIDRRHLALLPDGATLINTARGSLVDQAALIDELATGRLNAVVDVTDPEILPADSPLFGLPNVLLTPHVAGSLGNELRRLAAFAIEELRRYAAGTPFADPVFPQRLDRTA
ncbi:hydroxyacid dehydrogenase [Streptomyces sp. NPDC004435]|uniref:hydroxyacid dehydrogenase n=1 Tax=Streptomyces sp. NPDC004435 TaxID=3364701 RepID=UPI003695F50A